VLQAAISTVSSAMSSAAGSPAQGPIIDQTRPISLALVVAVVCGVLMALLIGWTMFEATSQACARLMQWIKPSHGSKTPPRLVSVDSAIWSAKENGTPVSTISEKAAETSQTHPQEASPSPSAIVSYYMRPDNLATPRPATAPKFTLAAHVVSPTSLSYYEFIASPTPDISITPIENRMAVESAFRAVEGRRTRVPRGPPTPSKKGKRI